MPCTADGFGALLDLGGCKRASERLWFEALDWQHGTSATIGRHANNGPFDR